MQLSAAVIRLATARQVCQVLGIEQRMLDRWIAGGMITPAICGRGKGGRHFFSAVDVLAIALARDLRRRGFSLADCRAALESLTGRELCDLQREWQAGRTHLLVVEGGATQFLSPATSINNPVVQAALSGKVWANIDVATAYAQLASTLDAQVAKEQARS